MQPSSRIPYSVAAGVLAVAALGLLPAPASAHAERRSFFPDENVRIHGNPHPARKLDAQGRPLYRPLFDAQGNPTPQFPRLVVCKKSGSEGLQSGEDSFSRISKIGDDALRAVNIQLLGECRFEHLQAAVDAVQSRGTTIYVLPGIYREQPSIRALEQRAGASTPGDQTFCEAVLARGGGALSYEEQVRCRHIQNTVAIFGDPDFTDDDCGDDIEGVCTNPQTHACNLEASQCVYYDLQIEGTGERVTDVIFEGDFITSPGDPSDGHFRYLNGIRADRADGIYLRNFTTQIFEFNAVYVEETDGYVLDSLLGRWVDEYSFLTFASDHGLYENCGGYGAADSVLYPGSGADIYKDAMHAGVDLRARQGTEIRNSWASHAAGGYSGTAGNSPWVHHNVFRKNQTGMATESIFGGHPGMPQDHGLFEHNLAFSNNKNYFEFVEEDGPCIAQLPRDRGVVPPEFREFDDLPPEVQEAILDRMVLCPGIPFPTGVGMIIGGGNYNVNQNNTVFDNWRQGYQLFHVPTAVRFTEDEPNEYAAENPFDNSHFNRFLNNHFAGNPLFSPTRLQPNAVDFWFDNSGVGNCWDGNTSFDPAGVTEDTGDPLRSLPGAPCPDGPLPNTAEQTATEDSARIAFLSPCIAYDRNDPSTKSDACPFFDPLVAPDGRQGETTAIASRPPAPRLRAGQSARTGYFVLNNDTGRRQNVSSVTLAASGPAHLLDSLTVSVTVAADGHVQTFSATLDSVGGSNVLTFAEPVPVPALNYVLFDVDAKVLDSLSLAQAGTEQVLLASGGGAMLLGAVLMAGGLPRRRRLLLALTLIGAAALTSSCMGDSPPAGGAPVEFRLTALDVTDSNGAVTYSGLPLRIGQLSVH